MKVSLNVHNQNLKFTIHSLFLALLKIYCGEVKVPFPMDGLNINERGLFLSRYMCLSDLMVKTPMHKTGDLRFKSQLRHTFFSQ